MQCGLVSSHAAEDRLISDFHQAAANGMGIFEHCRRTSQLVERILCTLDVIEPEEQVISRLAASMHDVGKLAISARVLEKPGALTIVEYEMIKHHPAIAENLLVSAGVDERIRVAVRHHHEWWNGKGYPDGLAGSAIPLPARVIAVADAFDAMTSDRPYRQAMSRTDAITELQQHADTQFDPVIVDAAIHVLGS